MITTRRSRVAALALLALLVLAPGAGATAAADPDEAITIENSVVFRDADPGERVTVDVLVKNSTRFTASLQSRPYDMARYRGGGEEVRLAAADSSERSAARWLTTTPAAFVLKPRTQQPVRLAFRVPRDARPGGHYVALNFRASQEGEPGQQVRVDYSVPVYVLLTVSGSFERKLEVRLVPLDTWRWRGGHATWDLQLHNAGDVHENVSGRVRVDGAFAGARSVAVDPGVLLPGERRSQRIEVDLRDAPDLWRADAQVRRDDAPRVSADADRVVVLPWWLLVLAALAVAVVTWRVRAVRRQQWDDVGPFPPGT